MEETTQGVWRFWMDTGGTFTDCLALAPDGSRSRLKVLSSGCLRARVEAVDGTGGLVLSGLPESCDGILGGYSIEGTHSGARGMLAAWESAARFARIETARGTFAVGEIATLSAGEEAPVVAMRLVTGTPLGRALPAVELRLATTRGTNALLEGKGARPALFVTRGFGDVLRIGDQRRPELFALAVRKPEPLHGAVVEVAERLAADGSVLEAFDPVALRGEAKRLVAAGVEAAAVALLHGYLNPTHERAVAAVLREAGFRWVSLSSELAPLIKIVPRAETAVVDAALAPVMETYLSGVGRAVDEARFWVMTSAGGLVPRSTYRPKDSLLSGPAGGVSGASAVARRVGWPRVLTFDMGGTSTDVARIDGECEYRFQHAVGPARVFAPALRVESVAAGGGSICRFDGAALVVGPASAGADPGPACYGAGGPLTLTDVNLLAGRLDPGLFGLPVFAEAAEARLDEVVAAVAAKEGRLPERRTVLEGFLSIADERMADAIRTISVREGYDPEEYALLAFGGAGGLHACAVAERLGMKRIVYPADSGLLSAAGLQAAVPERIAQRQILRPWSEVGADLEGAIEVLRAEADEALRADGVASADAIVRRAEVELRFAGQEAGVALGAMPTETLEARFRESYERRYGYLPVGRETEVVALRVVVSGARTESERERFEDCGPGPVGASVDGRPSVARRDALVSGMWIPGNTLVQDRFGTLFVARGWSGVVGSEGTILLERTREGFGPEDAGPAAAAGADVVELELFTCRFSASVEESGELLRRCASSVNVKERLDFSCALLDAAGGLVANAPHIPVHLGALGECVRRVAETLPLGRDDVAVTNHPGFGGSHLPDVTLVAPVHADDGSLLGYVANRAHHAEIGGMRPGSMPPMARSLEEEGVVVAPMLLARAGRADWEGIRRVLTAARFPTRAVEENLADLHAQLAAARRGVEALRELARTHGAERVRWFMGALQARSAGALAEALRALGTRPREAADTLDDGTIVRVTCGPDADRGRWTIDFAGTAAVHPGNFNATPGIVRSAVIYVLRLLAGYDLPLNEGLLRDVDLRIPAGSMLAPGFPADPSACPAVVAGNVETSQRLVDVLVRAFGLSACSQGTMNNTIFGNARFSCYETIGGGAGAGPGWHGANGVHTHMTNTAITDAEVMELRMPVRVERFALRAGSGGGGRWRGGDGLERRLRFLEPVSVSLLGQRRVFGPPGAEGGADGAVGRQWIERATGEVETLDGVCGVELAAGDVLALLTPGGGGWGR
ncbi:hydantoinase B/oxoprolinase family protein [Opitutales bacterium ASA1]|uniref:hydantoinase B/oxoprolinase family protein n=1 Tax=Congregicoccus parvus TaxID=3081749 RepID=UPI002B30AEBF|nr:hydantoinase B/oxoprolinase family protein [Opitutales bacterium ASA1]